MIGIESRIGNQWHRNIGNRIIWSAGNHLLQRQAVSYQIAKRLIKIKFIGLVNLIMDKEVVKELIQDELTVDNIVPELKKLLLMTMQENNR